MSHLNDAGGACVNGQYVHATSSHIYPLGPIHVPQRQLWRKDCYNRYRRSLLLVESEKTYQSLKKCMQLRKKYSDCCAQMKNPRDDGTFLAAPFHCQSASSSDCYDSLAESPQSLKPEHGSTSAPTEVHSVFSSPA